MGEAIMKLGVIVAAIGLMYIVLERVYTVGFWGALGAALIYSFCAGMCLLGLTYVTDQ